jgi:adenosylcobinamide-GDP ribazoletransferase
MKKEIRAFFTAIMFFTRIPCPKWVDHSEEYLNKASKYLPIIGWIVGGFSGLVYFLLHFILPNEIALLLAMVASIWITGAFHEDGLADVCDGFGGGWTKEKILDIMKDPRVGAFGVIGIVMVLLLKYITLMFFSHEVFHSLLVPLVFISAHSLSRFAAISFLYTHEYARTGDSKSRPLATKLSFGQFIFAFLTGVLPLVFMSIYYFHKGSYLWLLSIIPVYITKILLGRLFKKWIGGYTGDCLGATQQICEVVFYLSLLALCR